MFDRRTKNVEIFKDTEFLYKTNEELKVAITSSLERQYLIAANEALEPAAGNKRCGKVVVSGKKTIEASEQYAKQGKKVCVLNFASATNPGGGVTHGSSAQEEAICRCTTLYPCLDTDNMWKSFYLPHRRADDPLYNDDCIFTPAVKVFKSDSDYPELLAQSEWWDVDVITCAAPNLRYVPSNRMNPHSGRNRADISDKALKQLLTKRIEKIFHLAIHENAEALILGAFGCGAFWNPSQLVASVFAEFTEKYRDYFDVIEYAVYHREHEKTNYEAFMGAMKRFF